MTNFNPITQIISFSNQNLSFEGLEKIIDTDANCVKLSSRCFKEELNNLSSVYNLKIREVKTKKIESSKICFEHNLLKIANKLWEKLKLSDVSLDPTSLQKIDRLITISNNSNPDMNNILKKELSIIIKKLKTIKTQIEQPKPIQTSTNNAIPAPVMKFLGVKSLRNMMLVSTQCSLQANDQSIWQHKCEQASQEIDLNKLSQFENDYKLLYKENYRTRFQGFFPLNFIIETWGRKPISQHMVIKLNYTHPHLKGKDVYKIVQEQLIKREWLPPDIKNLEIIDYDIYRHLITDQTTVHLNDKIRPRNWSNCGQIYVIINREVE